MREEHLTATEIKAYLERSVAPAEALSISDHLIGCASCRDWLQAQEASRAAGSVAEVNFEEMAAFIDNELDPLARRAIAGKLAQSARGAAEIRDLELWKAQLEGAPAGWALGTVRWTRWVLPLAAGIAIGLPLSWWSINSLRRSGSIALRDGGRDVTIDAAGRAQGFKDLPGAFANSVAETLRTGRIEVSPEITALAGRPGVLASSPAARDNFRALAPVATAVRDGQPRFRWTAVSEATAYRLNVLDEASASLVLSEQIPAGQTDWQSSTPLAEGREYQWEVEALRGDEVVTKTPAPPEPEARFRVLSQAKRAELDELQRASGGSH
ncbi:MAG: hypothetical protein ABR589_04445, partial [Chthoniobacterales bacterium]